MGSKEKFYKFLSELWDLLHNSEPYLSENAKKEILKKKAGLETLMMMVDQEVIDIPEGVEL